MTTHSISQFDVQLNNGYCVSFESYDSAMSFVSDNFMSVVGIYGNNEKVANLIEQYEMVTQDFLMEVE